MNADLPLGLTLIDYVMGASMWLLITRFCMSIFIGENSNFLPMRITGLAANPILKWTRAITPSVIIDRLKPLYVAAVLFILRFYVLPIMLGYSVFGISSLPLEGDVAILLGLMDFQ